MGFLSAWKNNCSEERLLGVSLTGIMDCRLTNGKDKNIAGLLEELKAEGRYVGPSKPMDHEKTFFPKYDEYEVLPGEDKFAREKRWDEFKNPYLTPDEDTLTKKTKDSK